MELYDLVTTLMKASPTSDDSTTNEDGLTADRAATSTRHEETRSREDVYTAHRPNIKYLISTFQANTDEVKDFLPRLVR